MIAAGFTYDPAQRSELFGDSVTSVLRMDLTAGQTTILQNLDISFSSIPANGNAISGSLTNGARLRLESMKFEANLSSSSATGGAIYLDLHGGSQLVIANSTFSDNNAISGGAIEIRLFDNSSLLIENSTFSGNSAVGGAGGALRVVVDSGTVRLRNNTFTNNTAPSGSGGAISIERAADSTGTAYWLSEGNTFSGNSAATSNDVSSAVDQLSPQTYLPSVQRSSSSSGFGVAITGVTLSDSQYRTTFTTRGYTPALPGRHIHFFFDTVPRSQAGMPGSGPWIVYGSGAPFSQYGIANRPAGATQLCALVANANHTVIQGSGNCVSLP